MLVVALFLLQTLYAQEFEVEDNFFAEPSFEESQNTTSPEFDFDESVFDDSTSSSSLNDDDNFSSTPFENNNTQSSKPINNRNALIEELKIENRQKPKQIPHPNAKKGLQRITSENVYIYDVKKSKQENALSVQFGSYDPVNLSSEQTQFTDLYNSGVMIQIDSEWNWLKGWAGSLNIKAGSGLFFSEGNAVFTEGSNAGTKAKESLFFFLFPNQAGLNYKLKLWDDQMLVPYAEGGAGYYVFVEKRDDDLDPVIGRWAASPTAYWAGGLAINLNAFSRKVSRTLDREYGINKIYLNIEYRSVIGLNNNFDLSSDYANAGFLVEY